MPGAHLLVEPMGTYQVTSATVIRKPATMLVGPIMGLLIDHFPEIEFRRDLTWPTVHLRRAAVKLLPHRVEVVMCLQQPEELLNSFWRCVSRILSSRQSRINDFS